MTKISTKIILAFVLMSALVGIVGLVAVERQTAFATTAATKEAVHVAHLLSALVAADSRIPLARVQELIAKLHAAEGRDIVVVDLKQRILAGIVDAKIGTTYETDMNDEVGLTIGDGMDRTFVEVSQEHPDGIKQVVVPIAAPGQPVIGAVILEYTPMFNELMQLTGETIEQLVGVGIVCLIGVFFVALSVRRMIADPLQQLTTAAVEFSFGRSEFGLPLTREDEIGQLAKAFQSMFEKREEADEELRAAKEELERRVSERTAELASSNDALRTENTERKQVEENLRDAQGSLLQISRQAGMAEVASSVLHNVGNVLNSVNVAASCLADNLLSSRVKSLTRVAVLLGENQNNLASFFTSNPQGKQLPGYLTILAEHLQAEQTKALGEIDRLQMAVEHIKSIVRQQQGFAKMSSMIERVRLASLVEDALTMNLNSIARHEVDVIREYGPDVSIDIDRHMAIQILVNLIRNGKDACKEATVKEKQLVCRTVSEADQVRIEISDNGAGIAPDNLTRIFVHGFTTKKDGHGFGLHSCALAAKELGGRLGVASEGLGKGATFTLVLPFSKAGAGNSTAKSTPPAAPVLEAVS